MNYTQDKADQLVTVEALLPFRLNEGEKTRVVTAAMERDQNTGELTRMRDGEAVRLPLWLASSLANHVPPKVGPHSKRGKAAADRAAA